MPVTRFDVTLRRPLAGFPGYEELKGRLHFAIDPLHESNRRITDVELAPRDAAGRVDVGLGRVHPAAGGPRRVHRACPPGRRQPRQHGGGAELQPRDAARVRAGLGPEPADRRWRRLPDEARLGRHLVRVAGRPAGRARAIGMRTPEARDAQGRPLRGRIYTQVQSPGPSPTSCSPIAATCRIRPRIWTSPGAILTVRDQPDGPPTTIAARALALRPQRGRARRPRPGHIHLDGGFEKGRLYQVTYTAEGAPVQGLAMAALREAVAWLKHGSAARAIPRRAGSAGPTPTGARRPGGCCARSSTRISTWTSRGARRSTASSPTCPAACGASSTSASGSTRRTATT